MRFSRLPLLWRVFAITAALLVVATLLLALTPVTIHASLALVEGVDLVVALVVMLTANLLLLRHTLAPLGRLVERMRTVDLSSSTSSACATASSSRATRFGAA